MGEVRRRPAGTELTAGMTVRSRRVLEAEDYSEILPDSRGMVIGYQGELLIVSFDDGRYAACERTDLY